MFSNERRISRLSVTIMTHRKKKESHSIGLRTAATSYLSTWNACFLIRYWRGGQRRLDSRKLLSYSSSPASLFRVSIQPTWFTEILELCALLDKLFIAKTVEKGEVNSIKIHMVTAKVYPIPLNATDVADHDCISTHSAIGTKHSYTYT